MEGISIRIWLKSGKLGTDAKPWVCEVVAKDGQKHTSTHASELEAALKHNSWVGHYLRKEPPPEEPLAQHQIPPRTVFSHFFSDGESDGSATTLTAHPERRQEAKIKVGSKVSIRALAFGESWASEYAKGKSVSLNECTLTGTVKNRAKLKNRNWP